MAQRIVNSPDLSKVTGVETPGACAPILNFIAGVSGHDVVSDAVIVDKHDNISLFYRNDRSPRRSCLSARSSVPPRMRQQTRQANAITRASIIGFISVSHVVKPMGGFAHRGNMGTAVGAISLVIVFMNTTSSPISCFDKPSGFIWSDRLSG